MLSTIELDNNLSFQTCKVYDISPHGMLTPELETLLTLAPYPRPQDALRILGADSEVFRVYNQPFPQLSVTLSHALPHQGRKR